MSIKSILIIAYDWPPRNSIAVYRPYAWAKKWAALGIRVVVITSKKCAYDSPLDLILPDLHGVKVIEVPYRNEKQNNKKNFLGYIKLSLINFLKKYSSPIKKVIGKNYDVRDKWSDAATKVAIDAFRSEAFDLMLSTFGPRSCHYIAHGVKHEFPQVKWVADYRDLWSIRHDLELTQKQKENEQKIELKTLRGADLALTVSNPLRDDLSKFLSIEVWTAYNGFDLDAGDVQKRIATNILERNPKDSINIVYTGMIYPGLRDPSPLFLAINSLIELGELTAQQIKIHFYGGRQPGLSELVSKNSASAYVVLHGHVSREVALHAQQKADMLLLLESSAPNARGVLTGKIFEYMVSGTPILSIGSRKDSAIGEMIQHTRTGVVCEQNVDIIKKAIACALSGEVNTIYSPKIEEVLKYSREKQAEHLLNNLHAKFFNISHE